jgi:hypothetical protein
MEKEMARHGLPWDAVDVEPITVDNNQCRIEAVGAWLKEHPRSRVQVLCNRFRSSLYRRIIDRHLSPDEAGRVSLRTLPRQRYDETNWWRARSGIGELIFGYLALAYERFGWNDISSPLDSGPDAYERRFLQRLEESKAR